MLLAKTIAVLLHILTAAAVFGLGLPMARQARAYATSATPELGEQGARTALLMTVFAVLTMIFALTAFVLGGVMAYQSGVTTTPVPFAFYPPQFHTALLLILVLIGVQVGLVQAGWSSLRRAVLGHVATDGPRKRIVIGVGLVHLLWVALLILMYWGNLRAGIATL